MKLIPDKELSKISKELEVFVCIDEFLKDKGICCISQSFNEFCDNDAKKWAKFIKNNFKKNVVVFHGSEFSYYTSGSIKEIKNILKNELKKEKIKFNLISSTE